MRVHRPDESAAVRRLAPFILAGCLSSGLLLAGCAGAIGRSVSDRAPELLQGDQAMQGCLDTAPAAPAVGEHFGSTCASG